MDNNVKLPNFLQWLSGILFILTFIIAELKHIEPSRATALSVFSIFIPTASLLKKDRVNSDVAVIPFFAILYFLFTTLSGSVGI